MDLSLEELANISITSVSKSAKPISEAPASVYVITGQDIVSSGATSLPESLRLAPNLQVARVDARNYAITARGFNNPFANKLLVLIDGRTVYSPLFSGVYWDAQDVVLEDLERIEVISGAGGTLWGANAVNGVINIVTRSAADTQGGLVSVGGSEFEHHAAARYGGEIATGHYRVYAKLSANDDSFTQSGLSTETGWNRTQAGFRMDWENGGESTTLQGDGYKGYLHQINTEDIEISGVNLLARKNWQISGDSNFLLQTYFDRTERDQPGAFAQGMNTFDIDAQHQWRFAKKHNLVWGAGYRYISDKIDNDQSFAFLPENIHMTWSNFFVRDEVSLSDKITLTLGNKWEKNPFTGWEFMPDARLSWAPDSTQLVWLGASRAVRTPSRIDRDLYSPPSPPMVNGAPQYFLAGGPDFGAEIAQVFELGYRSQPWSILSFSATAFYSEYDQLRTLEFNTEGSGLVFKNLAEAHTYGLEFWSTWQLKDNWRLYAGFVRQEFDVRLKAASADLSNATSLASADPKYYASLRSNFYFTEQLALNANLRYVDELELTKVPDYAVVDLSLNWSMTSDLELSLVGQNLFNSAHAEFGSLPGRSEFEPAFFAKLTWSL